MRAVKKHQLEGIVAKRSGSQYRSGERSAIG
jgi:ATP-dependent DNA ligase